MKPRVTRGNCDSDMQIEVVYLESPNGQLGCYWCTKKFKTIEKLKSHNTDKHMGHLRFVKKTKEKEGQS